MLDPAPAAPLSEQLFRRITWFTPNESEAAFYTSSQADPAETEATETDDAAPNSLAATLLQRGAANIVLKQGSRGAWLQTCSGSLTHLAPFPVRAVDSTAAGDAFNGAFATALMLGRDLVQSARFASAAAALSVTRAGAQPSMPSMNEVEAMLQNSQP